MDNFLGGIGLRHKILRQSGKTLKEAKKKLEAQVQLYCLRGWSCDGNLLVESIQDYTEGKSTFKVSQKIVK